MVHIQGPTIETRRQFSSAHFTIRKSCDGLGSSVVCQHFGCWESSIEIEVDLQENSLFFLLFNLNPSNGGGTILAGRSQAEVLLGSSWVCSGCVRTLVWRLEEVAWGNSTMGISQAALNHSLLYVVKPLWPLPRRGRKGAYWEYWALSQLVSFVCCGFWMCCVSWF